MRLTRRDLKYYLRVNAHNYPARHRQIEDIRGRRRSPVVEGYVEFSVAHIELNREQGFVVAQLRPVCHLFNTGRVTAHEVSLVFNYPEFSRVSYARARNLVRCDIDSDRHCLQLYLDVPIHPGQNFPIYLGEAVMAFEYGTFRETNTKQKIADINFPSMPYVGNAPPISIDGSLASDRVSRHLRTELAKKFEWTDPEEGAYKR